MATLTESVLVRATLREAWDVYFDSRRWASWVDGFAAVERSDGYPQDGATLVWRSNPAGRGTVTERVVEHSPRRVHRIEFTDPESNGELRTRFAIEGEAVRVALELDYRLASGGPFAWLADRLFVRSQVRASLRRSLLGLKREAEEPVG